jgi:exosome complex RNA-binding protein Rrp42 (RNase PH superfamily)
MAEPITKGNRQFIREATTIGLRDDGRQLLEMRQMKIIFNEKNDGVEVSLGKTKVYAKISSKIIEPSASKPSEGKMRFLVNLRILQDTQQSFNSQKGGNLATEIGKVLERGIKGSK